MTKLLQRAVVLIFIVSVIVFAIAYWQMSGRNIGSAPVITMEDSSITVSISSTEEDILAGVSALDAEDGDVTDSLIVESMSNFVEVGRRLATIVAFDSDNHVTRVTREIVYSDYESPRFSLSSPLRMAYSGTSSIESTLTATDCLDGDLSAAVTMSTDGTVYGIGTYAFTYEVTNSVGDTASLTATVEFYDASEDEYCPHAVLSEYLIYVEEGEALDPENYLTGVMYRDTYYSFVGTDSEAEAGTEADTEARTDTDSDTEAENDTDTVSGTGSEAIAESVYTKDDVQIYNPVDTSTPGTYEIAYTMRNSVNYYQTVIRLIVVVE